MSTFKGILEEFPDIRIDYFRKIPEKTPPLACFLSHVHSDHLQGLESLKSPFVYCSPATRELLLRLERYPHRMNFVKGILESRKQEYKHLKSLLKTIPLNVPTEIELTPNRKIRVTLLDANHCAGAVMFLIEGDNKAVLYTGDIRSEPWWVNALLRNPVAVPYTLGKQRLDKIYLDTTFATKRSVHRAFPTKAEGVRELLEKVSQYAPDTIFHFHAWTFGYEDVWIALASALKSQIHVDHYKMRLYRALTSASGEQVTTLEGPALCGFKCGNRHQPGCLTNDATVRVHSCEHGTDCPALKLSNIVLISPIITRAGNGEDIRELGAGGGLGDLLQSHELELNDTIAAVELMRLCSEKIDDPKARSVVMTLILEAMASDRKTLPLEAFDLDNDFEEIPIEDVIKLLQKLVDRKMTTDGIMLGTTVSRNANRLTKSLPKSITFPYSRHSSYEELCHLVEVFKPRDVYPCTVDEITWSRSISMQALFGDICSSQIFSHDKEMIMLEEERKTVRARKRKHEKMAKNITRSQLSQSRSSPVSDEDPDITLAESNIFTPSRHFTGESEEATVVSKKVCLMTSPSQEALRKARPKSSPSVLAASVASSGGLYMEGLKVTFETRPDQNYNSRRTLIRTCSAPTEGSCKISGATRLRTAFVEAEERVSGALDSIQPPSGTNRRTTNVARRLPGATQAKPIELSDASGSSSEFSDKDQDSNIQSLGRKPSLKHNSNSGRAKGLIAANEVDSIDDDRSALLEGEPLDSDGHVASQVSMPDSAFDSQQTLNARTTATDGRIEQRKEAYKAARGINGRTWVTSSPFASSNTLMEEELEL